MHTSNNTTGGLPRSGRVVQAGIISVAVIATMISGVWRISAVRASLDGDGAVWKRVVKSFLIGQEGQKVGGPSRVGEQRPKSVGVEADKIQPQDGVRQDGIRKVGGATAKAGLISFENTTPARVVLGSSFGTRTQCRPLSISGSVPPYTMTGTGYSYPTYSP